MQFGDKEEYKPGFEGITFIIGICITVIGIMLGVLILGPIIASSFPLGDGSEWGLVGAFILGWIPLIPIIIGLVTTGISAIVIHIKKNK